MLIEVNRFVRDLFSATNHHSFFSKHSEKLAHLELEEFVLERLGGTLEKVVAEELETSFVVVAPTRKEWIRLQNEYGLLSPENISRIWLEKQCGLHELLTGKRPRINRWSMRVTERQQFEQVKKQIALQTEDYDGFVVPTPAIDPETLTLDEHRIHFLTHVNI